MPCLPDSFVKETLPARRARQNPHQPPPAGIHRCPRNLAAWALQMRPSGVRIRIKGIQGHLQGIKTNIQICPIAHADAHRFSNGPVTPQKAAIGQIARVAACEFRKASTGLALINKICQPRPEGKQVFHIVCFARRAGKERGRKVKKAHFKTHAQFFSLGIKLGGVCGLDVG